MSFTIQAAGRIADVIEQVKLAENYGDSAQMEAARALILAELEAWPTSANAFKGVLVEANGHHDTTSVRNLAITIRPLHLRG